MSFNKYKSIDAVLQEFLLTYTERNFIEQIQIEIDPYFQNRLDFILIGLWTRLKHCGLICQL